LFRFNQPTIKINQKPFIHHSPDNKKGPYYRTFSISFSFEESLIAGRYLVSEKLVSKSRVAISKVVVCSVARLVVR
jgi:hypothetical protein